MTIAASLVREYNLFLVGLVVRDCVAATSGCWQLLSAGGAWNVRASTVLVVLALPCSRRPCSRQGPPTTPTTSAPAPPATRSRPASASTPAVTSPSRRAPTTRAVHHLPPGRGAPAPGARRAGRGAGRRASVRLPPLGDRRGVRRQDRLHELSLHPLGRQPLRPAARLSGLPRPALLSFARRFLRGDATAGIWRPAPRTPAASAPAPSATPARPRQRAPGRGAGQFQGALRALPPGREG